MRVALFGGKNRGSAILNKLLELQQQVVGVFYFEEDPHEKIWYEKMQDVAVRRGISSFNHTTTSKWDLTQILRNLRPEIMFVVSWRYRIERAQYSIPPRGCVVFHDSLLPKYRGFAPMNWAIINGEKRTGVTMFYIANEIDSGDIIAQKATDITADDDAKTLDEKLTRLYIDLLVENLPLLADGSASRTPQDHSEATYTCKRIPEDGLIDWKASAEQVRNLVRALTDPCPGAYTFMRHGKQMRKLYIWRTSLDNDIRNYVGCVPGRVVEIFVGKGIKVLTGSGTLVVEIVSLEEDTRKVRADQVVRSIKATLGMPGLSSG